MRKVGVFLISLAVLACGLAAAKSAQAAVDAAGTTAGSFLTVGAGTSALAMAGATLASGRDLAAAAWNPASLARVDALQFSFSHAPLPGGATQDWLAAGGRFGSSGTRWALQSMFQQEGSLEGRDALNAPTGALSVSDLALGARLAHAFTPAFSTGIGAQWVHESLAGVNGSGFAFDAGLRGSAGPFGLALAGRNLGGGMRYGGTRYDLPGVFAAGLAWSDAAHGVRLEADFESPLHYYRDVRVGGEWLWHERVALRAGYRLELGAPALESLSGATFGLGTGVGGTWLDYAYAPDGATGMGQHRIGLTFRPGLPGRVSAPARDVRSNLGSRADRAPVPGASSPRPAATPRTPSPIPAASARPPAPVDVAAPPSTPPPASRPSYILVAEGETLAAIARRWHTNVTALMEANDLVNDSVSTGMRLRLPPATPGR